MRIVRPLLGLSLVSAIALSYGITSCQPAPINVPLRTFERAQRMDFVCMHVRDAQGFEVVPEPVPLSQCSPVAPSTDGTRNEYHLYALVTQSVRGEVAVVDLTAQRVVDQNREVPGVNFLPVGQLPVDVASTPDGRMSFVTTADPFKPAIYALPSLRILGNSQRILDAGTYVAAPNLLPSWPVCVLPQQAGPISVMPRADGYDLAVVLPGDAARTAKIVLVDAKIFEDPSVTPPGALAPCPISAAIEISDTVPAAWSPGVPWPDGVPYATVDSSKDLPRNVGACTDVPLPNADAGPDGNVAFTITPLRGSRAHPSWAVRDGDFLFVADNGLPLIHVFDISTKNALTELPPYVATSLVNPDRIVTVSQIAISPRTRDLRRYMYALDEKQGSVLVYDVTDPRSADKAPMVRPHPELNPFQPADRIAFASPVASLAFARHDFPITQVGNTALMAARSGLLCNPNGAISTATLSTNSTDEQLGALYRTGESGGGLTLAAGRLRGIFGFITLADGKVVTVDVDDWDAPCRRPAVLDGQPIVPGLPRGLWDQKAQISKPSDPWGAPGGGASADCAMGGVCGPIGASNEGYFPISTPHRLRSNFLLSNDATTGQNLPAIVGVPQLLLGTKPISPNEALDEGYASLQVFLSREEATVNADQEWSITFEGPLPGFDGLSSTLDTEDGWKSLTFSQPAGHFCARGVQDLRLGQRVVSVLQQEVDYGNCNSDGDCHPGVKCVGVTCTDSNLDSMGKATLSLPERASQRTADYVQISDELLPPNDSYWTLDGFDCWSYPDGKKLAAGERYQACLQTFGTTTSPTLARELPVLEAYDGKLVAGRFLYSSANQSVQSRIVAPQDATGETSLKLAQCCFHKETRFRVRTGNQWVAIGTASGYLHHLRPDPATKACVASCDQRSALLNARAIDLLPLSPTGDRQGQKCTVGSCANKNLACVSGVCVDRNTPFALRNPLLAAQLVGTKPTASGVFASNQRDLTYKFTTRGRYTVQTVNLATSTPAVSPQSMRYIEPLGQMGIVDGSSLGLVLIDLNTLVVSKTYN